MVTRALLFPGQGAQYPGMGKDLFEASPRIRQLFEVASEMTHIDMKQLLFEGSEEDLKQTEVTQPAITLVNMATMHLLEEEGIVGDVFAGFSLGELSAFHAAGIFSIENLFRLAGIRGALMAEAAREAQQQVGELGMAAVIGLSFEQVKQLLEQTGHEHLYVANDNSEKQVGLAGTASSIEAFTPQLKESGARRVIPLKVSAPFHTPFLDRTRDAFVKELEQVEFHSPTAPVYTTVTGSLVADADEARAFCSRQLTAPVRWTTILGHLTGSRYPYLSSCLEVGPGKTLSGFWRSSSSSIACIPVGTAAAVRDTARQLRLAREAEVV